MIQEFISIWDSHKTEIEEIYKEKHPDSYFEIVENLVALLSRHKQETHRRGVPDPKRIHKIDDSDYQGTLVFVIAEQGYTPSQYWVTKVYYGSCSGCDTLQAISEYSDENPTKDQVDAYMMLTLHVLQGLKEI